MRTLPVLAAGALMLTVGLADPAAAAVVPTPTPSVTVTPTPAATSSATPTPVSTATPTPTTPGDEPVEGEVAVGAYTSTPATGPAGTVVTVTSTTPCLTGEDGTPGQVEIVVVDTAILEDAEVVPAVDTVITAGATGDWTTKVTIPAGAANGVLFGVGGACFAAGEEITDESVPAVFYSGRSFVVAAPTSPVAVPVVGTPTFTG